MSISFKNITLLSGPLGQVVDGTQNANSHNGGRSAVEEDRIKDVQRDGKQQERMVLVEGREENRKREGSARLTELAMLPEKERGLVTPRLETMRESTETEGKRRNRREKRRSALIQKQEPHT